ncbi:hypothetical protein GCM10025857_28490 [Alicyclobacillus contaminans]|nr:hypothetical protein GCM10025857_28490 [Alicyclobacillus contaminans]
MSIQFERTLQPKSGGWVENWRDRVRAGDLGLLPVILALIVIWVIFESVNGNFLSGRNLSNLTLQITEIGMLGIGETFILLLGEIDLSIAAVSGVAAAVLVLLSNAGINPWICIIAAILTGVIIGGFQGIWVTMIGVPAFIVTLAGSLGYQGILLAFLGSTGTVPIFSHTLLGIAASYIPAWAGWIVALIAVVLYTASLILVQRGRRARNLSFLSLRSIALRCAVVVVVAAVVVGVLNSYRGFPVAGLILLAFVVLFSFVTQSTVFGRHIYAVGGNKEAARRAGINIRKIRIAIFTLSGAMGAIGGIIGASRLGSASPPPAVVTCCWIPSRRR